MTDLQVKNAAAAYKSKFTNEQLKTMYKHMVEHVRDGRRFTIYPDKKRFPDDFMSARFVTTGVWTSDLYVTEGDIEVRFCSLKATCAEELYMVAFNNVIGMCSIWDLTEKIYWLKVQEMVR